MLRPSMRMSPSSNGRSRLTSLSAVVFPPPEGPTRTQNVPAGIPRLSSCSAAASRPAYRFVTRSKTISAARDTVRDADEAGDAADRDQAGGDRHREAITVHGEVVGRPGDRGTDNGNPEQAGDARDRVVYAGCDAGVRFARICEHRGGERRDDQREPDSEDDQRREQSAP